MCETRRQHALSMQIEVLANPLAGFPLQRSTLDVQCSMFAFNRPKSLSSTPFIRHSETRNSSFPPGPRESTGKPVFNCQARYGRGVSPEISPGSQAEQVTGCEGFPEGSVTDPGRGPLGEVPGKLPLWQASAMPVVSMRSRSRSRSPGIHPGGPPVDFPFLSGGTGTAGWLDSVKEGRAR